MGSVIIQVDSRHGRVAEIAKSDGKDLRIGRSYNNDLVLTDPYVAPQQLRIYCLEDQWHADIQDHTNPVLVNGKPATGSHILLQPGDRLRVGRTNLTVYSEEHQVEHTRKLLLSSWLHHGTIGLIVPIFIALAVSALNAVLEYALSATTEGIQRYFLSGLFSLLAIVTWAGIWSVIGRLLRHQPHFAAQLLLTAIISGVMTLFYPLSSFIVYNANSLQLSEILTYIMLFVTFGMLFKFNLFFATNIKHSSIWGFAVSGTFCLLAYSIGALSSTDDFKLYPIYSNEMQPPIVLLAGASPSEQFFTELEQKIDQITLDGD